MNVHLGWLALLLLGVGLFCAGLAMISGPRSRLLAIAATVLAGVVVVLALVSTVDVE